MVTQRTGKKRRIARCPYPHWVGITCCLVPLVCLLMVSMAAAFGLPVSWPVAASISVLCQYVIKAIVCWKN